ncbi:ABC transporter ATP-binding protein [Facklamia hominis]
MLECKDVSIQIKDQVLFELASLDLMVGQWWMICGPNGAGKSSFLKALSGEMDYRGSIFLKGRDLKTYSNLEKARHMAFLPQIQSLSHDYLVEEVVALGRYPYLKGFLKNLTTKDWQLVNHYLNDTGIVHKRRESLNNLSGGERQKVFLSQAFAQEPSILLLDEPSNFIDLNYQKRLYDGLKEWLRQGDRIIVSVVHDLSLAKKYGSHALLLKNGQTLSCGSIQESLADSNLNAAYDMDVRSYLLQLYQEWLKDQ